MPAALSRSLLLLWLAGEAQAFAVPTLARKTAYSNISRILAAGGCKQLHGEAAQDSEHSEWELRAGSFACSLGCQEHEPNLASAFEPWWDHKLPLSALNQACERGGSSASLDFIVAIINKRVFLRCCSTTVEFCTPGSLRLDEDTAVSDRDLLLTLVKELAQEGLLPDMMFVFNVGDQPFIDKTFWGPVPQFHWVQSTGHWSIPLPNPFHLMAHFQNFLGDSAVHRKIKVVPWKDRIPKVFWRGSLSAPDKVLENDFDTIPRLRLLRLAKAHPKLFDVGIVGFDEAMQDFVSQDAYQKIRQLPLAPQVDGREEQVKYRYTLSVAAVLSSWRLPELMASGSVLLLQSHSTSEVIYGWLTPWEHFVPIDADLSDLVPTIEWLEAHPERAERIAASAAEVFRTRVRRQDTYCYLWQALRSMHSILESEDVANAGAGSGWSQFVAPKRLPKHTTLRKMLAQLNVSLASTTTTTTMGAIFA